MGGVVTLRERRGRAAGPGRRRRLPPRPGARDLARVAVEDVVALLGQALLPARLALRPLQPELGDRRGRDRVRLLCKRAGPARDGGGGAAAARGGRTRHRGASRPPHAMRAPARFRLPSPAPAHTTTLPVTSTRWHEFPPRISCSVFVGKLKKRKSSSCASFDFVANLR